MMGRITSGLTAALTNASRAALAWGQVQRMHDDDDGLTVMAMALGLVILLVPLAILLMTYTGDAASDAEAAFDGAVAGS